MANMVETVQEFLWELAMKPQKGDFNLKIFGISKSRSYHFEICFLIPKLVSDFLFVKNRKTAGRFKFYLIKTISVSSELKSK